MKTYSNYTIERYSIFLISIFIFLFNLNGFGIIKTFENEVDCNDYQVFNKSFQEEVTYVLFKSANNSWGYDILINGQIKIHQPNIPSMPGDRGFKTKIAAQKTAELAIKKIHSGLMPPTISIEELKKLNAIN